MSFAFPSMTWESTWHVVGARYCSKNSTSSFASFLLGEQEYWASLWEEVTQQEIAKMLGISRSYVSRIEKKALKKLYAEMK